MKETWKTCDFRPAKINLHLAVGNKQAGWIP
jgi:4-diphosphocytidyl-2C-methyl-D-erythritol kinase